MTDSKGQSPTINLDEFKILQLDSQEKNAQSLTDWFKQNKIENSIHIFFGHFLKGSQSDISYIEKPFTSRLKASSLEELEWTEIERRLNDDDHTIFTNKIIKLPSPSAIEKYEKLKSLGLAIREFASSENFTNQTLVIRAPAIAWDAFNAVPDISLLSSLPNVYEYLIWFSGQNTKPKPEENDFTNAWQGEGLTGWRYQWDNTFQSDPQDNKFQFTSSLQNALDYQLEQLRSYEQALSNHSKDEYGRTGNPVEDFSYLITLANFLPSYRYKDTGELIRGSYRKWSESEGPMPFNGLHNLRLPERHLLLDGWLTPYNAGQSWQLRVASLALLYWAAQHLQYPYCNDPDTFMRYYFDCGYQLLVGKELSQREFPLSNWL